MDFLKYRKIYFIFSGILILASLIFLLVFGLRPGMDFTGGSILEIEYINERPSNQAIAEKLKSLNLGDFSIQPTAEKGIILRMKDIDEETHQKIIQNLRETENNNSLVVEQEKINLSLPPAAQEKIKELRFESIGPTVGLELKQKTKVVVILSLLSMVLYIVFAFRRISRPIKSWQYGIVSLFALCHDVLIPLGIFAVLGKFYDVQITIPIIVAFLTVVGYAINNVVVVFDRIRENLLRRTFISFEETTNFALNQTLSRQINTSLTTLLPLLFIFFIGGETLKYFALVLILGISFGLYSSIFLVGQILVSWSLRKKF